MKLWKPCCGYSQQISESPESRTPALRRFACGVGNVINDVIRQLLFSFRLVFFMKVLGLSASNAGWLILYGQVSHVAISPLCAFLVDKINISFLSRKLGRRKSWHLIGTVLGAVVVPLYFSSCFACQSDGQQWQMMANVAILNTFLSLAASFMEIAHLSIIPVIAKDKSEAVEYNAWRTGFTFSSGILTYLVAWAILGQDSSDRLSPESSMDFTVMTLILIGTALIFSAIFYIGTKEPSDKLGNTTMSNAVVNIVRKSSFIPSNDPLKSIIYTDGCDVMDAKLSNRPEEGKNSDLTKDYEGSIVVEVSNYSGGIEKNHSHEPSNNAGTLTSNEESKSISIGHRLLKTQQSSQHKTVVSNQEHIKIETPENDFWRDPVRCKKAVGVDNHGCDCKETESKPSSPDKIVVANVDEVDAREGIPNSSQIHCAIESGTLVKSKPDFEFSSPATPGPKTVQAWLKDLNLYKVGIIYTCAKVLQVISYSYLPLFLTDRLQFGKEAIANLPLIMLISATISSGITKKIVGKIGTKWTFILAGLLVIGSALWCYFITQSTRVLIYLAAVLLGFGLSAMSVTSLSFAAELVGDNKNTSAFVFAFMGLMSNLTGGALYSAIQKFYPSGHESEDCDVCGDYVRYVFSIVPGSLAAAGLLIVLVFQTSQPAKKQKASQTDGRVETEKAMEDNYFGTNMKKLELQRLNQRYGVLRTSDTQMFHNVG